MTIGRKSPAITAQLPPRSGLVRTTAPRTGIVSARSKPKTAEENPATALRCSVAGSVPRGSRR